MTSRIRIVIADDHAMVREGVRHVMADTEDFEVVADVASGGAALAAIETHRPEVALLDLSMPEMGGSELVARARELSPETKLVILSMHSDSDSVSGALAAGAAGYLLKDEAGPAELRDAVRAVAAAERAFSPGVTAILADAVTPAKRGRTAASRLEALTSRETEVLQGIAEGMSNKQLAKKLGIGRRTVESHRESLMRKLDIRNVAGLTRFAIEVGLVPGRLP